MPISSDFTINTSTQRISHTSGTTVYSVNAFYSWLMDTFAQAGYMSYDVPTSAQTPTVYSLINSWELSADTDFNFLNAGAITVNRGGSDDLWANVYTIGSIVAGTQTYIEQNNAVVTGWWSTGHIDLLMKVKSSGSLIDSGKITIYARELGTLYDNFQIDLSAGGRNPVPLATSTDLDNQTASGTIAGYSDISLTFTNANHNLSNGNGAQPYNVTIDCAGRTLAQTYEYLKYLTRRTSTTSLNSRQGQIYQIASAGYTAEKRAPFGTFAGGKFFGARGVWITNYAANQSFQLIDANGTIQAPPTVAYVAMTSVVSGDQIFVVKLTGVGGSIEKNTYTLSSKTSSTLVMTGSIASDTPSAGYIRVIHSGTELRFAYTSWAGSTFSGVTPDPTGTAAAATDAVYVPYLDLTASGISATNNLIYSTDRPVRSRVRKKGILPFEIDGTLTSTGYSQAAIRTTDTIVT